MIQISNLKVELGNFTIDDISLKVNEGEYFIILGPTGAGKTIILESIAGLHQIKGGQIWLKDIDVTNLEPEKRGVGIVYQDQTLFPHLSVKENIVFGLRLRKTSKQDINEALDWITGLLGISPLLQRLPLTLSGGEQQKVALARALVTKPTVLLLDEPLSSLDPETREGLQDELRQLQRHLNMTTIHVTHDFEEAVALGHKIAVIAGGKLKQVGTPEQIFRHPNSEFVARFAMTRNIFTGKVVHNASGRAFFATSGANFLLDGSPDGMEHATIRPEDILLSHEPVNDSEHNCLSGVITRIINKGSILFVTVNLPPAVSCLATRRHFEELGLREGQQIYVIFKGSAIHLF